MMRSSEIVKLIAEANGTDDLEIKVENRHAMNDFEADTIIVERVKTPDYIRICRIYRVPIARNSQQRHNVRPK